jgi:hypothetical protein
VLAPVVLCFEPSCLLPNCDDDHFGISFQELK